MAPQDIYRANREVLEAAIEATCRKFRLSPADAEDFAGDFQLRLIKDDYAVLRRFQGRSSLRTYLLVVVTRAFQDWRNARWGKWRPSAEARRLGPLAVRLETLVVRDRCTLDEASEILRTNLGITVSRASLEALAVRFPERQTRRFVADDMLERRPAIDTRPDAGLERVEATGVAHQTLEALDRVLERVPAQDRLILRMRFEDCLSLADIARALHLEQKPLYRRVDRLLEDLRRRLEQEGLSRERVSDALSRGGFDTAGDLVESGRAGHSSVPSGQASGTES